MTLNGSFNYHWNEKGGCGLTDLFCVYRLQPSLTCSPGADEVHSVHWVLATTETELFGFSGAGAFRVEESSSQFSRNFLADGCPPLLILILLPGTWWWPPLADVGAAARMLPPFFKLPTTAFVQLFSFILISDCSNSKSCPIKFRFGEIMDRRDLTKRYASIIDMGKFFIKYATAMVGDRDTPA